MNEARFRALLDAYGADLRRWPEAERADAARFAQAHPDAAAWAAEAAALDALLDLSPMRKPSDLLARRILAQAPRATVTRWAPAMLAASLALGVLIGFGGVSAVRVDQDTAAFVAAALDGPGYDDSVAGAGG